MTTVTPTPLKVGGIIVPEITNLTLSLCAVSRFFDFSSPCSISDFNQITCPSVKVCFAVAENDNAGFAYRTLDGGETWEEILVAQGVSMMSAKALNEQEVYLGGGSLSQSGIGGKIYYSNDSGNTFTETDLNGYYLTSFAFPDAKHGFATAMNTEQTCNVLIYTA